MKVELPVVPGLRMDLPAPDVTAAIAIASVVADGSRAGILRMLGDGPHCVCEMAAALGQAQNNVSNHLARLRDAGLVRPSHLGHDSRRVYYERDDDACAAALASLREILG